jgi:hypothetical protein
MHSPLLAIDPLRLRSGQAFAAKNAAQDDDVVRERCKGRAAHHAFAYFSHFRISGRFGRFP